MGFDPVYAVKYKPEWLGQIKAVRPYFVFRATNHKPRTPVLSVVEGTNYEQRTKNYELKVRKKAHFFAIFCIFSRPFVTTNNQCLSVLICG